MSDGRLAGKIAVVTGGARGIGRATVERFRAEGAEVVVWDLDAGSAENPADGANCIERVDVADALAVAAAAAALGERLPGVDILINNAGINLARSPAVGDVTAEEWRRVLDVNLSGALHCTQSLLPLLRRRGGGRIVNFSSILAVAGFPGQTAYAAAKAGLLGLTRVWARELGPAGITVNAVVPGYIDTAMNSAAAVEFRKAIVARTALRRLGTADDVARVCLFLASDDAAFVTGAAVPVDGGLVG
ncbi:MAG: SDR family oxidoreductase [Thermoanaerobaculia bacterium]|nr:SDR family oxidoreductase [Thermoanaerobaculia bacterium]MBP9825342.1 SDR family oxidoreductase [Thermoanaerobaculia bacterium]